MRAILERIAGGVEKAEPTAHCRIDPFSCQIIVSFDRRSDVEISLLTPMAQSQVKKGKIDQDLFSEMLFSVRKIANFKTV